VTRIAGSRRVATEVLHIDYATVLAASVRNERIEALRQARAAIASIQIKDDRRGDSWNRPDREGSLVRRDALAALDRLLDAAHEDGS
jgi:hypothetical protein